MSNLNYDELMQPVIAFLGCETPKAWLDEALNNLPLLMQDHANCEKKAAGTAMNLMFRYSFFTDLQVKLAQLVREEMLHYEQVLEFMTKRGQEWQGLSAGRYAGGLRKEIRTYEPEALIDILVIGAFVEARSCERFYALAPIVDEELGRYYRYLLKSESRHYEDYLTLALDVAKTAKLKDPEEDIQQRIELIREVEKELILSPDKLFRFHSGVPMKAVA
ncbi:tRNA-(ms[2]io[6]A)-hydroxylase [Acinetobacter wuhouensis]|uniref:tRNA-(Ms[2]io[6]A)-hydroxylase n=1 Tax=Acinetobacter wuhouensis TaxID=1879050 RepID=A0A385C5R7_9GAMM|nr:MULTISPECIES: tRNA-(ms[2]io[6]A)-hydroxylase [Acinetobacter]AXQ22979.1 tRNA-(ms[2]io[6]A)-hydroxylase [Acinetobacter wuhouensis]AYO55061.1 tRNA-(ms[2]io[6]A)-hydroxylase [Acinetobacter wuhouensis]RZG49398.1 tRNA-(ms[2]io[6]A)-hydroxylase [Acinetobacter wuhouensis]RZG68905.1 tRNA-(ms[2]io[6]A)-hydroxylase [Acinetobacter wuhouensis]RZG78381.1 tRNA-(ms[2]io[6]A)-hydroxylase [Acinetobacter sp. WCHAc060033]